MSTIAIYPGTFDPITNGHLDLVLRSTKLFDEVIVAVSTNASKSPLFTEDERVRIIKDAISGFERVRVETFDGLLTEYAAQVGAVAIVRGLRAVSDFEYEMQMGLMNRRLNKKLETLFMMPPEEYSFITSTMVKEVASFGGSVKGLVPAMAEQCLIKKFKK